MIVIIVTFGRIFGLIPRHRHARDESPVTPGDATIGKTERGQPVTAMGFVTASTAMARKMGYKTPKFCKIVDWRLTITNLALQVVITFYVLYALIRGKTYLQTEVPIGKVTNWGNGNDVFSAVQEQSKTQMTTAVETVTQGTESVETTVLGCNGVGSGTLNDYKFDYDDTWKYTDVACAYLTPDELITKETTGGMFITTHITESITQRVPGSTCASASGNYVLRTGSPVNGVCYYDAVTDWLAIGAEHTSIGISHEYDTLTAGKSGANPKTYVRRAGSSENLHVFEAGKSISLKLKEILDVAQVDLDKRYEDQTPLAGDDVSGLYGLAGSSDAARTPMARLAGVRLKAQIRYYNYNLEDADSQETGSDEPYAILEIEPSFTWTSKGQKISYRTPVAHVSSAPDTTSDTDPIDANGQPNGVLHNMYAYGVHIDITTSGMIGSVNYVYLINVLVSGLVMLKLAGTICDLIAMYGLGTRSLIYSNHMLEEANFVKESAKYAVQGMMAVTSFQAADSSGSGNLDINELYEWLVTAFHADDGMSINEKGGVDKSMRHRLTLRECKEMARYIMAAGDRQAQERFAKGLPPMSYEELKAQRIDLEEWIELCTEGPMDIPTLKKVIAMDNEEQEAQRKLREMFGE